jgi:putative membrane protein
MIAYVFITALSLLLVAELVPGIEIGNFYVALVAALVLGLLNLFVKPVLVILTLPITIVTLGLFIFIINAFLFLFAASFVEGFAVTGFLPALVGSLIVSLVSAFANRLLA